MFKRCLKKLEIGTFLGICTFQGLFGNNEDFPIFPELWGRGNSYFNEENWGIFGVGTDQIFWGITGKILKKIQISG